MQARRAPDIRRCDLLHSPLNAGKAAIIQTLVRRHRKGAPLIAREQWRQLFENGDLDRRADAKVAKLTSEEQGRRRLLAATIKDVVGSAGRVQMLRYQVVGQMRSWLSNRANGFREIVEASTLTERDKHILLSVNQQEAWFTRLPLRIHGEVDPVPQPLQKLARQIMKTVMGRHRRPSWDRLPVQLDRREALWIQEARNATQGGRITHWLRISSPGAGKVSVPLQGTPPFLSREGKMATTVQINCDDHGFLTFGVVRNVSEPYLRSRQAYRPRVDSLALDYGLRTLFTTDKGDLLGRGFKDKLKRLDETITAIKRHAQRSGQKPSRSKRYRRHVIRAKGFIKTEVGRVMNAIVTDMAPREIVLEKLDFRSSGLSPEMNRMLSNCGRGTVRSKLKDLSERYGIASTEVASAYTSQCCSSCGYVHSSNRNGQAFRCRRCGLTIHADVNAARNIAKRRSLAPLRIDQIREDDGPSRPQSRGGTLERLRQAFERKHGAYGSMRTGGCDPATDCQDKPLRFAWDEVACKRTRPAESASAGESTRGSRANLL